MAGYDYSKYKENYTSFKQQNPDIIRDLEKLYGLPNDKEIEQLYSAFEAQVGADNAPNKLIGLWKFAKEEAQVQGIGTPANPMASSLNLQGTYNKFEKWYNKQNTSQPQETSNTQSQKSKPGLWDKTKGWFSGVFGPMKETPQEEKTKDELSFEAEVNQLVSQGWTYEDAYNTVMGQRAAKGLTVKQGPTYQAQQDADYFNNYQNTQNYINAMGTLGDMYKNRPILGSRTPGLSADQKSAYQTIDDYEQRYKRHFGKDNLPDKERMYTLHQDYGYKTLAGMSESEIYNMFMSLADKWYGQQINAMAASYCNAGFNTADQNDKDNQFGGHNLVVNEITRNISPDAIDLDTLEDGSVITLANYKDTMLEWARMYYANAAFKQWLTEMLQSGELEAYAHKYGTDDIDYARERYSGIDTSMNETKKHMDYVYGMYLDAIEYFRKKENSNLDTSKIQKTIETEAPSYNGVGLRMDNKSYGDSGYHAYGKWPTPQNKSRKAGVQE